MGIATIFINPLIISKMYEWYFYPETQAKKAAARKTTSVAQEQDIGEHDDYEMEIDDDESPYAELSS